MSPRSLVAGISRPLVATASAVRPSSPEGLLLHHSCDVHREAPASIDPQRHEPVGGGNERLEPAAVHRIEADAAERRATRDLAQRGDVVRLDAQARPQQHDNLLAGQPRQTVDQILVAAQRHFPVHRQLAIDPALGQVGTAELCGLLYLLRTRHEARESARPPSSCLRMSVAIARSSSASCCCGRVGSMMPVPPSTAERGARELLDDLDQPLSIVGKGASADGHLNPGCSCADDEPAERVTDARDVGGIGFRLDVDPGGRGRDGHRCRGVWVACIRRAPGASARRMPCRRRSRYRA